MARLIELAQFLDQRLDTARVPDDARALNGLQLANQGDVFRVATAVDFSVETVGRAVAHQAQLLIVHHGMFWGGLGPIIGASYERVHLAVAADLAVYASHLPLDCHETLGNNVQLAHRLELIPTHRFGRYQSIEIGCSGMANIHTAVLVARVRAFAEPLGASVITTPYSEERLSRHWAVLTGAGASTQTLQEATERGIDTLIVGEGPHHTAVDAQDRGLVVIYAGHYATETLGVQALGADIERTFGLPSDFIHAPSGL